MYIARMKLYDFPKLASQNRHISLPSSLLLFLFQSGLTPLHWSILSSHNDICALLIEAKADVDANHNVMGMMSVMLEREKEK